MLILAVGSLATFALVAQSDISRPAPPARVELAHGIVVTATEYLDHLYAAIGSARLEEMLLDRVLEREAAAVGLDGVAPEVATVLRDPTAHARRLVAAEVAARHGGDGLAWERSVWERGVRPDEARWAMRVDALREARIAALVQSRRVASPEALRRVFEGEYGVDGLRVVVRHVFQSFGAEREKVRAAGGAIDEAEIAERVRKRVATLAALQRGGAAFHALVARGSEDPVGRALALDPATQAKAGVIEGYNFQHFGEEFAAAVRAMQPGDVVGPVRTSHGYHLIELVSAVRTKFEDVEARVRELLRLEMPSLAERRVLLEGLRREYGIDAAVRERR